MGKVIDLKQAFAEYFHELEGYALRSERFYDQLSSADPATRPQVLVKWMEAAFIQGARVMAQDTVDTLGDYGTACSGLDQPRRNPTQCYDAARDSLMVYFTQVLQDAEEQ